MVEVRKSGFLWTIPILITLSVFNLPANAKYSGGTGEPNDPYQIATGNATRIFYLFRPPVILLMSYIFKFSFLLMRVAEEVG